MVANLIKKIFNIKPAQPKPTRQGTKFKWIDNQWIEVCDFCGGNCGQCGWSIGMKVPANMDTMIKNLHKG